MKCLCCGKDIDKNGENGWHKSCIKRFFGASKLPEIEIDDETLKKLADETVNNGLTVPGVQKKLSLHLISENKSPKLTIVNFPTGYILKPQVPQYETLPEAEHLVMSMADITGITTVPHALIGNNGNYAYITKRADRIMNTDRTAMLAMEDFCQLDLRLTQDKYKGSYERCAKVIERYSSRVGFDMTELFMRLVFSFVTGNSDMHLKNFSLIETAEKSGEYVLSPAYDLLPVNVILPADIEQTALTLNGKKRNIRRKDFYSFAYKCGIPKNSAENMIKKVVSLKEKYEAMCRDSLLSDNLKECFIRLMNERCDILS